MGKQKKVQTNAGNPVNIKVKNSSNDLVKLIVVILIAAVFVWGGLNIFTKGKFNPFKSKAGEVHTVSKASLEQVLETSRLSTLEYTYNAVATVKRELFNSVKYYVAYEGTVKIGVDFANIDVEVDEDKKEITIVIPDIEIQEVNVKPGSMQYIFVADKYETETISQEAYKKCEEDLAERVTQEEKMTEMAKDSAVHAIQALIEPWVKQVDDAYTIIYK